MYKSSKKSILVFKGDGNSLFNEAQFIINDDKEENSDDIIKEANRIIAEYGEKTNRMSAHNKKNYSTAHFLSIGFVLGFGLCLLSLIVFNYII